MRASSSRRKRDKRQQRSLRIIIGCPSRLLAWLEVMDIRYHIDLELVDDSTLLSEVSDRTG